MQFRTALSMVAVFATMAIPLQAAHAEDGPRFRMNMQVPLILGSGGQQPISKPILSQVDQANPVQLERLNWTFASDRNVTWSIISGPTWLSLEQEAKTAVISGTPADTMPFTVVLQARSVAGAVSEITAGPVTPAPATLPVVTSMLGGALKQHESFSWSFASDHDVDWSIVSAPPWFNLSETSRGATVTGTPANTDPVTLVLRAARAPGIHVDTTVGPLAVEEYVAPVVAQDRSISVSARTNVAAVQLASTGGKGVHTWSVVGWGNTPPSNTIAISTSGVVTGTFNEGGTYRLNVLATDGSTPPRTATGVVTFVVSDASPLTVTAASRYQGRVGQAATFTAGATVTGALSGYTITNEAGGNTVPGYPGLTINPATGVISGVSTVANTTSMSVPLKVTDGLGRTKGFAANLWVAGATPILHLPSVVTLYQGKSADQRFAFSNIIGRNGVLGGTNCIIGGTLPPGLSYNTDCTLFSTPSSVGTYNITLSIVDSDGKASAPSPITIKVLAGSAAVSAADQRPVAVTLASPATWSKAWVSSSDAIHMLYDGIASTGFSIPAGAGAVKLGMVVYGNILVNSVVVTTDKPFYYRALNGSELWVEGTGQAGTTTIPLGVGRVALPTIEFTSLDGSALFVSGVKFGYQGKYAP